MRERLLVPSHNQGQQFKATGRTVNVNEDLLTYGGTQTMFPGSYVPREARRFLQSLPIFKK